jgi:hypothetical protein
MSRVFISYRRADSGPWASRLYRHLTMRFGKDLVFQDVDDIRPGTDFLDTIRQALGSSQVFLVLIGPSWLVDAQGRRRLHDPNDVLRMEVAEALSGGRMVIPVLVGAAVMPSSGDLPDPLRPLSRRQAVSLAEARWIPDVEVLIERLREVILPSADDMALPQAEAELSQMQHRYFEHLEHDSAAEALDLAQKTQAYLDRVLPLYPQDPGLKLTRGYLFKNEAMALMALQRHREADEALRQGELIFRTAIDERPTDAGAWNGLGSIEAVRGHWDKAHEDVDEALRIVPDYPAALHDHEQILGRLGKKTCDVVKTRASTPVRDARRSDAPA